MNSHIKYFDNGGKNMSLLIKNIYKKSHLNCLYKPLKNVLLNI